MSEETTAKQMMANLVREFPADMVIHRSMSGFLTGAEMVKEIEQGTEIGKKYASDLMRVARDLLARQAEQMRRGSE